MKQGEMIKKLKRTVGTLPDIEIAFLFGSWAKGTAKDISDVDIAVAGTRSLDIQEKLNLISKISADVGREVDLVDLQTASGAILLESMGEGKLLFCKNQDLYSNLLKKLWYYQADFVPLLRRIYKQRRERLIHEDTLTRRKK